MFYGSLSQMPKGNPTFKRFLLGTDEYSTDQICRSYYNLDRWMNTGNHYITHINGLPVTPMDKTKGRFHEGSGKNYTHDKIQFDHFSGGKSHDYISSFLWSITNKSCTLTGVWYKERFIKRNHIIHRFHNILFNK